jgi:hypothetical protein
MTNKRQEFVSKEIDGKWVVIDRQLWEQEHPTALLSLVGSSRLAAGPFGTEEEAENARARLAAE